MSHRVTKSLALVVAAPRPVNHCPRRATLTSTPRRQPGTTRRTKGAGTPITPDHLTPRTLWLSLGPFFGSGSGTRHTWPSNLVEDWHPVAGDSRLAGLPPSLSEQASPVDTHRVLTPPVCNNRENPATPDRSSPSVELFGRQSVAMLPKDGNVNQGLPKDGARKRSLLCGLARKRWHRLATYWATSVFNVFSSQN